MSVSNRTRQILEMLLRSDRDLTAAEMAAQLQVSSRTVHRELTAVEELLREQGVALLRKSGLGIGLQGDPGRLERLRRIVHASEDADFSPDERHSYLLGLLLQASEPLKLFTLANELKVTIPTVSSDLDELADWVRKLGVTLIRRRGYGVELTGREEQLRETIRELIKLRLDDTELITNGSNTPRHPLDQVLFEFAGKPDMEEIEHVLWSWEERWTGRLSEQVYTDLLIRLSIALQRMREGRTVSGPSEDNHIGGSGADTEPDEAGSLQEQIYREALRLTERLSERLNVRYSRAETAYVSQLLQAARAADLPLPQGDDLALADTVRTLIRYVQAVLNVDFSEDRSLRDGLFDHMKIAVQRLHDGLRIRNPLLEQIRKDYAKLFGIVREGASAALPTLAVPDEEIGFLVMHFGASLERLKQLRRDVRAILVCTSGIGSSTLLQTRLHKELPQIDIVDRVSWYEAARIAEDKYDLIISTIDLPLDRASYIKVSPLLTQAEADQLRAYIRGTTLARQSMDAVARPANAQPVPARASFEQLLSYQSTLGEIVRLTGRFKVIRIAGRHNDLADLLEEACRREADDGVLTNPVQVRDQILVREQQGSQLIPGTNLALFHTRSPVVKQPSLTLYVLGHPLQSERGPPSGLLCFLLMLAPRTLSKESLEVLSEVSAMLLDEEMIERLEAADEAAIRSYLIQHLKKFFSNITESE